MYVKNQSTVAVVNLRPDTTSNFIYVLDDDANGSHVSGVNDPLFVPKLTSSTPPVLSQQVSTQFMLKGNNIYPCGLNVEVYKDNASNLIVVYIFVDEIIFFFFLIFYNV
jgi:hypothetical protein